MEWAPSYSKCRARCRSGQNQVQLLRNIQKTEFKNSYAHRSRVVARVHARCSKLASSRRRIESRLEEFFNHPFLKTDVGANSDDAAVTRTRQSLRAVQRRQRDGCHLRHGSPKGAYVDIHAPLVDGVQSGKDVARARTTTGNESSLADIQHTTRCSEKMNIGADYGSLSPGTPPNGVSARLLSDLLPVPNVSQSE